MELATELKEDVLVICPPGIPLDHSFAQEFKRDVQERLKDHPRVVLNLSRLLYMDSSGLGVLVACYQEHTKTGGDLRLCRVPNQIQAVFSVVRMASVFKTYATVEEAVNSFHIPAP
jgi:anti-sigma B factor antagonist